MGKPRDLADGLPTVTSDEFIGTVGADHRVERIIRIAVAGVSGHYVEY
jgi:hypothetical protein